MQTLMLLVLAFSLLFLDMNNATVHRWRERLNVVVLPLQSVVDAPIRFFHWLGTSVALQHDLLNDNAKLRANDLLLRSQLQKVLALKKENGQLKRLLSTRAQITGKVKIARILAIQLSPALREVIINAGSHQGVHAGQPVLDGYGVMGQVIDTGLFSSRVLLIDDQRFAIPVEDYRNGMRAIASGTVSPDRLAVLHVTQTSDVKVGDLFVSSGYGLRFPVGYPVGVVGQVKNVPGLQFLQITLVPSAHLNQTQQVLLAWPREAALQHEVMQQMKQPLPNVDREKN